MQDGATSYTVKDGLSDLNVSWRCANMQIAGFGLSLLTLYVASTRLRCMKYCLKATLREGLAGGLGFENETKK